MSVLVRQSSVCASIMVVGLTLLVACGSGNASPTASPVVTGSPSATQTPTVVVVGDACTLITASDIQAAFGPLKPGTNPTPQSIAGAAGPPGMLSGSACSYRFPGGDVSVLMARFQDSATASSGMKSLMDMLRSQSGDASIQFRPITGLGDEAAIYTGTLPPPTGGQAVGLLVRKGAVAFMLSGGFAQGSGPADLGQATEALARIASARI